MLKAAIVWQTNRFYTEKGQRIAACTFEDGILFYDCDRGIDGFIRDSDVKLNQESVMYAYDHNHYHGAGYSDECRALVRMLSDLCSQAPDPIQQGFRS